MHVACFGVAVLVLGAWQGRDAQRPVVRSGIAIFEDADYGGRSRTFTVDVRNLSASGFNDRISSIVVAEGEMWELCVDPNYNGQCTTITNWEHNLADSGWNDKFSSIRRMRGRGFSSFSGRGAELGAPRLEIYAGANYTGSRKDVAESVANLRDIGFNDRAMSLRIVGTANWEICVNANFDECRVISDDVPNLGALGLERLLSSVRPRSAVRGRSVRPR